MQILEGLFVKKPNEIFSRHLLATRRQKPEESLREYLQALQTLSKDCDCQNVTGEEYRKELCRDAFINGLESAAIRQRLLENKTLSLEKAFDQANALDLAIKNASAYQKLSVAPTIASAQTNISSTSKLNNKQSEEFETFKELEEPNSKTIAVSKYKKCFFCGRNYHERKFCPAKNLTCNVW